jgi:hypothetical protein
MRYDEYRNYINRVGEADSIEELESIRCELHAYGADPDRFAVGEAIAHQVRAIEYGWGDEGRRAARARTMGAAAQTARSIARGMGA